jgi:hypothetical protein
MGLSRVRRASVALLALTYVLGGTQLALGLLDRVSPLEVATSREEFRCAHHACGCSTAEQCRSHCCCSGEADAADAPLPSGERTISYVALARCAGHDAPAASPGGGPEYQSLPGAVVPVPRAREGRTRFVIRNLHAPSALERPPTKVPI